MDFTFSEDQLEFQEAAKDFLVNEVTPERIRGSWKIETGRNDELWAQLVELGLVGMTIPEEFGGLGMTEIDFVLIAQECGFVALPEPLVHTALVAVPVLNSINDEELKTTWLSKIATGEAKVVVGLEQNRLTEDAHIADLLILDHGSEIHAVPRGQVELEFNESVDPSRKLFRVQWSPSDETLIASGEEGRKILDRAFNGGALACAAQSLGLAQRMVDISVQYTAERHQFGKPIGSFQAVKHHMANIAVRLEYAKAPVARAAYEIANNSAKASIAVSHAKFVACEAAQLAAKNSIQVHGAMGYTWEVDLHIFMKKAWALTNTWGDEAFHKSRVAEAIFADNAAIGAGGTFN